MTKTTDLVTDHVYDGPFPAHPRDFANAMTFCRCGRARYQHAKVNWPEAFR